MGVLRNPNLLLLKQFTAAGSKVDEYIKEPRCLRARWQTLSKTKSLFMVVVGRRGAFGSW